MNVEVNYQKSIVIQAVRFSGNPENIFDLRIFFFSKIIFCETNYYRYYLYKFVIALCLTRGLDPEVDHSAKIKAARVSLRGGAREARLKPEKILVRIPYYGL